MTGLFPFLALLFLTLLWLSFPLLPALNEWRRKTDITPLCVVREYDGNVRYFARGFRDYVTRQIEAQPSDWETRKATNEYSDGIFSDGSLFCVLRGSSFPVSEDEMSKSTVRKIVLARAPIHLPPNLVFALEVFAYQLLRTGDNSVFRAVLAEADVVLGANNSVLRWLHCQGQGTIGASSSLYGRASSDTLLVLDNDCHFQRLHAPRLVFGSQTDQTPMDISPNATLQAWLPDDAREQAPKHYFVRGDLHIPANVRFEGNLVVTGVLHIGAGAQIEGATKSHGDTILENGSRVYGSMVSAKQLILKNHCYVRGPLISEDNTLLGEGCQIGDGNNPTTVSAPQIKVHLGVVIYGTAWAREAGKVVSN